MRISILAPRAGRDLGRRALPPASVYFNPRAPCGARPLPRRCPPASADFNPRAPCGARPYTLIHASTDCRFQSARPVRGATRCDGVMDAVVGISIRAPRAGRDAKVGSVTRHLGYFNPRAPCGARRQSRVCDPTPRVFQSARPVRGATFLTLETTSFRSLFQSARPVRGATLISFTIRTCSIFQSARPVRGATPNPLVMQCTILLFQSARPVRGATAELVRRL